jgi:hypothetical protein
MVIRIFGTTARPLLPMRRKHLKRAAQLLHNVSEISTGSMGHCMFQEEIRCER